MIVLRNKEPELEQREFGFYTSKIKRPIQIRIGKTKAELYKKISESAANSHKKAKIAKKKQYDYLGSQDFSNQNPIAKHLYEEAEKANTKVGLFPGSGQASFIQKKELPKNLRNNPEYITSQIKKSPKKEFQIKNSVAGKHSIKIDPEKLDLITLAHEVGHAKNHEGLNGKLQQKIHFKNKNLKVKELKNKTRCPLPVPGARGSLKSNIIQNLEEINASRSGIKMLKDAGMSKEDIKKAQKRMKEAYKTYFHSSLENQKLKLAKKLEFKGGNSIRHRSPELEHRTTILRKKQPNRLPKKLRNSMNELQNTIKDINKK